MSGPTTSPVKRKPNSITNSKKMTGYRFIDKDPAIDLVIARILESQRSPEWIERETERIGRRVSASCIIGWLYGNTRRPQNYTIESVMLALGVRKEWIDIQSGVKLLPPQKVTVPPRVAMRHYLKDPEQPAPALALPSPPAPPEKAAAALSRVPARAAKSNIKVAKAKASNKRSPRFDWSRQDVIDRVFALHAEQRTIPQIAQQIATDFETEVKPSSVRYCLENREPSRKVAVR